MFLKLIKNCQKGYSLIELIVAMFILAIVMTGMVAISVAGFRSYQRSRAVRITMEDVGFAINSISKDVRMGKIEPDPGCPVGGPCLVVRRTSTGQKICYAISDSKLSLYESGSGCSGTSKDLVVLPAGMKFDTLKSKFYYSATDILSSPKVRGWVEVNLDIQNPLAESDSIRVQTTVSSRDYGF